MALASIPNQVKSLREASVLSREPAQVFTDRRWSGCLRCERQVGVLAHPSLGDHPSSDVI